MPPYSHRKGKPMGNLTHVHIWSDQPIVLPSHNTSVGGFGWNKQKQVYQYLNSNFTFIFFFFFFPQECRAGCLELWEGKFSFTLKKT